MATISEEVPMTKLVIPERILSLLREYVAGTKRPELIATYLRFVEELLNLHPVLYAKDKLVFRSVDDAIAVLEAKGELWRETEIKIGYTKSAVNEQTTKIYICPFTGKVFGNNTHPNPQDAIYDWVAKCPENTERAGGVKAKRFFITEDPEVIKSYREKCVTKEPITKIVYSSAVSGKLFHSKEAVIDDFRDHYLKRISLVEVQGQSRFQIEDSFMQLIEEQLQEDKIASFVEGLSECEDFAPYIERWLGDMEQEG
jgi:hypothetical protein